MVERLVNFMAHGKNWLTINIDSKTIVADLAYYLIK